MRETITLNRKEQTRAKVLTMVLERRCTSEEGAELLRVSSRHLLRLKKAFREEGPGALAHGNRGRKPAHAISDDVREGVLRLATSLYHDYNHSHLQEELVSRHDVRLSRRSVARILTASGLRSPRRRRPRRHRSRRARMPRPGVLLPGGGGQGGCGEGGGGGGGEGGGGERALAGREERGAEKVSLMLLREVVRRRGI